METILLISAWIATIVLSVILSNYISQVQIGRYNIQGITPYSGSLARIQHEFDQQTQQISDLQNKVLELSREEVHIVSSY